MKTAQRAFNDLKTADQKGRIALGVRYAGKHFTVQEQPDGTVLLTPVVVVAAETERPLTSRSLRKAFAFLEDLQTDWDGRGLLAPTSAVIAHAREVVALLGASALARSIAWQEPHIGCNERGEITLEWWRADRSLTIFVRSETEVDYLKGWGANIVSDMEGGSLNRIADFVALAR